VSRVGVLHLVDTLAAGGAESVAVNLVNGLPRARYRLYLGTTRAEGPLAARVAADVERLRLARRGRFDPVALRRLIRQMRVADIRIIHAHGTAVFLAALAAAAPPHPILIWHDHFGRYLIESRPLWIYWLLARRLHGVVAVNESLAGWAQQRLRVRGDRVWYIPNFAALPPPGAAVPHLPGVAGQRIVCVANLRRQKDHPTLVQAMARVVVTQPAAHLLLVGAAGDAAYHAALVAQIAAAGLEAHISLLGGRDDVAALLRAATVGVLSSRSEGLPLALLEYGVAGLPVVATAVGQCPEVLEDGAAGLLVPAGQPAALAAALLRLLTDPAGRAALGARLQARVQARYSPAAVLDQVAHVYETVLGSVAEGDAR